MPARRYSAYLVRHWSLPGGAERIEVQHIQSGESTKVPDFQAALEWMGHQGQEPPQRHTTEEGTGETANSTTGSEPSDDPRTDYSGQR
jgi:hypothetical protein